MNHEFVFKHLDSTDIAISIQAADEASSIQTGMVLLDVEYCVIDVGHLDRASATGQAEHPWEVPGWCSLVGRIIRVGEGVDQLRVGDRVSALGSVTRRAVLPAQECLIVPDSVDTNRAVYWALLVALTRLTKQIRIELGESVLVLAGGLCGDLMTQLSLAAGATLVMGVDFNRGVNGSSPGAPESKPAPIWFTDQSAVWQMHSNGEVDVLVDVLGDVTLLESTLSLVREGGRAMLLAANNINPADFDFYPHLHRRSLNLTSSTLKAALTQNSIGEEALAREAEFINHLLITSRLNLPHRTQVDVRSILSREQIVPTSEATSLIIHWTNNDQND